IIGRELRRSIRTKSATGIVLLDVDHFKAVNDTHGHPVGDEVLVEFGARCARAVRDYDVVALISAADTALYEAKRAGRARLHVAAEADQPDSARFPATEPDTLRGPE